MKPTANRPGQEPRKQTIAQLLTDGKAEYLDYDFRARLARRDGKPFDLAVAEKNLLALKAVFDRHGIRFWLVFGTCLGAVRDGGFIPHDTDTDLAVFAHDKPKVIGAIPDLIAAGLRPIRTKQPDDLLTFMREDEYIDIGFFGRHRDQENCEYWSYQNNRVYGDHFDRFEPVTFLQQTFLVPQRVEVYLTTLYGAGWKSPVKNLPAKEPQSQREFRSFSDLLVLADFFRDMPGYAVLKLSEHFPHYHDYSDIDILCADPAAVLAHLRQVGRAYERRGFTLKLDESNGHLHLDFFAPGAERLNFRFDLLSGLDVYRKLAVTPDFAPAILADRIPTTQHGAEVFVPALPHDLALRFLEFVEWKDERPDKIKHWQHIEKTGNYAFIEIVNRFTDLQVDLTREAGAVQLTWARRPQPAPTQGKAPSPPPPDEEQLNSTLLLCNDCLNRQDFPAAWQALGRALELSPHDAGIRVHRGRLALLLNDEANAARDFAEALRLDPRCAAAHAGVARLFFRCQQLPEAEQAADRALGLDAAGEEALQVKAECAAARAAPRPGATNDYYPVAASCPIPEAGDLYEKFFSRRTNGTFVECGPAPGGADSLTQVLADLGWKGCRVGPDDCRAPAGGTNPLRQALSTRQVEPGFELLCVTADGGGCSLLASAELNYWRPQLVMLVRSGDDPADDAYPAQYFQEHQYLPVHQHGRHSVYAAREKLLAGRSRMDCFLIWGHGTQHWENILERIRARAALEIVAIHRRPTGDMTRFVQDLYACDTVPFEHLRAKTRYLLTTPAEVVFILVRNHNAQEKYYGEGAFRHIQCALIKDLKEEVRNAWNPRVNGQRSEDHVIHATDYESQVVHTLQVLGLPGLELYQRQPNRAYDLPYHLAPITRCREVELPLDQLHARILGQGIVPIEQTPQYRYVAGKREPYLQYFARHFGKELCDDHSAAAFDRLIKEFNYGRPGRNGKPSLLVVSRQPGGYLLHDGVHRAAILKHRNVSRVKVLELLTEDEKPEMPSPERTAPVAAGAPPPVHSLEVRVIAGAQKDRWQHHITDEVAYWDGYIKTRGRPKYAEEFATRLQPDTPLQETITKTVTAAPGALVRILDVGAGPLTWLGKRWEGRTVELVPVDPLANHYHDILQRHGVQPPVATRCADAEALTNHFPLNHFEVVHARNSIDHSYDAPYAIEQMLAVTKPGGWVILGHGIRESTAQQGQGLHQWDFFSADGDFVIESRQHLSVNLTHRFAGVATVQCEVNREKQWLRVCMQKLVPTVLQPVPMTAPAGPAGDGPAFQLALREGEQLLRQGRLREARTRLEQAVKLAPTAGCAARAEEILTLLPGHASPAKADAPVVVKLMGGLGNQLFQYAAGLALARKNQVPLKLDLTFLQDRTSRPHLTPRDYALAGFPLHDGCELIREAGAIPAGLKRVAEKHFHYDPAFADLPAGVLLEGYWQSPRYFEPIAAELRRNLAFAPQLGAAATALAAQIGGTEAVCLHVRRGDMVHDARTASVHGSCAVEYYRMACDVIAREFPAAHFFIFSDDPHWCGAQDLTRGRPHTVVSQDGAAGDPLVDLDLMRRCRHFITANSTFSWWAAFLGGAAGKRVIVPDPWFTDPSMDISDLFPQDWIHLSRSPGPVLPDLTPAPAVSVIVPCYKQAHYLPEAVASVVGQTFADWELIVVNDGSPDETSRVARDLIARHPGRRIRLLEKPNGGLADARNAGIREARGRLILPLDADDKLHPQMLQKTVALLKAQPRVAIVYTDLARFGSVTDVVALPEYDFKKLVHQNQLNCCSLFRREAWAAVGGYNPNMKLGYEDWDFWIGCGEKGFFGQHLPEPLFFYRVKNSSMFTKALEHHHALHAQIIANHPRLYDEPTRLRATGILAQPATAGQPAPPASAPADALKGRRILVYTDDPGQGGAAHYNHALLLALVEAGAQVACAQPRGEGPLVQAQAQGGIQHCWTAYNPVVDFGRSFVDEDDARRILEQARPELVFFSDCCAFSHLAAKQAVLARDIPFVVICHSEATYLAERFARYLPTVQVQLERARAVIGVSQSSLGVMRRHFGLAADKGQVIYNGCAENYFAPADPAGRSRLRADLALPADAVLCFTAARLDAGKCHQLQLEAIRRLRDSGRLGALHFAWAGDGDLRPQLEQQVKALKLEDRVHLLGYRWDVRDLMGAADIFVLTTLYEAMPLCILEAMARGLPVLASAVGGIPEELGETGILLPDPNLDPQKTISTLANALVGLAADAPRRQAMSAAGKARAQQLFSARRMLESTLAVMGQALAEQSAAADEFFGADEVRAVEQLCTAYAGNPADAAVSGQLQSLQQGLMNFLVTAPTGQLEAHFKGSLGQVFRALCKSGLPSEPPTDEARAQLAVLDEVLTGPPDPLKGLDYRPLLARMLRAPAHRGATTVDPDLIPAWLLEDYLGYVLTAPPVFVSPGEAEEYHAHVLSWARTIQRRTRQAPAAAATIRLATAFANRANCIPLYSSRENLREIAQLRAAILEFVLTRNGAAIDAKLPRRPKHRQRIKVGFLSAHFGAQTETHVTLPALQLDREKFEVCLFPVAANPGPVETYCRSFADSFTPLPANLHQQVKVIRAAALDVLIIGTNITAVTNQVALIALHRLAPVQLATYCSPSSTGMRHIDGYLTGTHLDIPGLQEHFSEKLRFCEGPPGCLDYTVERPASAVPLTRAGLGLAADEVVFINAAACFKILPELQETWAKILRAVPNSRLLLLPFNPNWANEFPVKQFERTLAAACARHGVARDRFILASSLPSRADVKALERLADVYLDTFPFSGSISVIDPLELGLPTVVGTGPTARSRAAAALLQELGLPELITADEAGYVALAVKLGTDPAYRRQLHDRILAAMAQPPRFINPPAYAQELGELLASLVAGKKRPVETLALA